MKGPTNANGTVTKIGTSSVGTDLKPIRLVNGVPTAVSNDLVSTSGDQNIANKKTFTGQIWAQNTIRCDPSGDFRRGIVLLESSNHTEQYLMGKNTNAGNVKMTYIPDDKSLMEWSSAGVVTAPNQRTYSASNTSDVVTIGSLQASTDVVHTSGNETISNNKIFTGAVASTSYPLYSLSNRTPSTGSSWHKIYSWDASNVNRGICFTIYSKNESRMTYAVATGTTSTGVIYNEGTWTEINSNLKLAYDGSKITLFCNAQRKSFRVIDSGISNNSNNLPITIEDATVAVSEPVVGDDYAWVVGVS